MDKLPSMLRSAVAIGAFSLFVLAAYLIFSTPGSPLTVPAAAGPTPARPNVSPPAGRPSVMPLAPTIMVAATDTVTSRATASTTPFRSSPTPAAMQTLITDCQGGTTTLEVARRVAGFRVLAPTYLPEGLRLTGTRVDRSFPHAPFHVTLVYRNLTLNRLEPSIWVYQLPARSGEHMPRPDLRVTSLTVRGLAGQLLELRPLSSTPQAIVTYGPNPTLTAFALGLVTADPNTRKPMLPCDWLTPVPLATTPNLTPVAYTPPNVLRWFEGGIEISVEGPYQRDEMLKVANSMQ